jgi:hypothetical protein
MAPIKEVLKTVPFDRVVMVVRQKVDRRSYPGNPPLTSWRDPSFLRAIAEDFCRVFAVPGLVREWRAAGKAPAIKTHESSPPAAPPAPQVPVERAELQAAVSAPATEETAPAAPPAQSNGAEISERGNFPRYQNGPPSRHRGGCLARHGRGDGL